MVVQLLRYITEKVCPPRALCVPFPHGYPLDAPKEPERQMRVIEAALQMLEGGEVEGPVIRDLDV